MNEQYEQLMKQIIPEQTLYFTSVRKDRRKKRPMVQQLSAQRMLELIGREPKEHPVSRFRKSVGLLEGLGMRLEFNWQHIYVAARFARDETGQLAFDGSNGLVLLTAGKLKDMEEARWVKRLVQMQPMTYAAFVGSSGRTVKILVRVSRADGSLPQGREEALRFQRDAYSLVYSTYEGTLGCPLVRCEPTLEQSFVRTLDTEPYLNASASPLRLAPDIRLSLEETDESISPRDETAQMDASPGAYAEMELRFASIGTRVVLQQGLDMEEVRKGSGPFLTTLARECCLAGIPLEEALLHAHANFHSIGEEQLRQIFGSAYQLASTRFGSRDALNKTQQEALLLRNFMRQHYVLRHNEIQDCEEYRLNTTWDTHFRPLDERMMNKMVEDARRLGIDVWDKDIRRYVRSAGVVSYNPVDEFLRSVHGIWDGQDHIAHLASTVPTCLGQWPTWFRRWLLGVVAQWLGVTGNYGNSVVPILIGGQGYRKSTFCRQLLPDELQFGYTDQLIMNNRGEVDRTICQYLLVNLDEFDQMNRRTQDAYLKNLLQRADIRGRRPYQNKVSRMRRYASFIGTSNQLDLLTDPSGSRRYFCVELTAPIRTEEKIDMRQLYAQAICAIETGERFWFEDADVREMTEHNQGFMQLETAEQLFNDYYQVAAEDEPGAQWMSASALMEDLRRHAGSRAVLSPIVLGRYISRLPGMCVRRFHNGTKYLVRRAEC